MERWKIRTSRYSRDLIEILQINGFTIERILEYGPSQIAKIIGIDDFFAQIIFNKTTKKNNNNKMIN
jgi:hypothetical protein